MSAYNVQVYDPPISPSSSTAPAPAFNLPATHANSDKKGPVADSWVRNVMEVLGSTVDQGRTDTVAYRLHGHDSWTWGDQVKWIKFAGIRSLVARGNAEVLEKYLDLERVVDEVDSRCIWDGYGLRNVSAVSAYMAQHPELTDFLLDSHGQLMKYFGAGASFVLEVVRDPEIFPPRDLLFVNIRTSMLLDEAMERLNQFDEAWYLDWVGPLGDLVNFNLEFYEL